MRDIDKMKEKIELTLDNRQVVSLVIGSLVVLGVVFVLGVMVGKQSVGPAVVAPSQDVLAVLDRKAQLPHAVLVPPPAEPQPDFVKELTGPSTFAVINSDPKPTPKAEKPGPKVEATSVPKAETPKVQVAKVEVPKPEPKAEAPAPVPEPKAEPDNAPSPSLDKKLADAFSLAKAAPHPVAEAGPTPPAGTFTVQVAASQQKNEVDQVVTKLQSSGLRPYEVNADIPGRGRWYRVRVGSFPNKGEAEKYVKDLKRETGMSGFVTGSGQ